MQVHIRHDPAEIGNKTTPSEGVVPVTETKTLDRNRVIRVTDSTGRILGVRRVGMVQRMRLLEAVGPETARNAPYMSFAMLAHAVVEIDGELCEPVSTKRQLEARVQQLDEAGLIAANTALHGGDPAVEQAATVAPEDLAKNG